MKSSRQTLHRDMSHSKEENTRRTDRNRSRCPEFACWAELDSLSTRFLQLAEKIGIFLCVCLLATKAPRRGFTPASLPSAETLVSLADSDPFSSSVLFKTSVWRRECVYMQRCHSHCVDGLLGEDSREKRGGKGRCQVCCGPGPRHAAVALRHSLAKAQASGVHVTLDRLPAARLAAPRHHAPNTVTATRPRPRARASSTPTGAARPAPIRGPAESWGSVGGRCGPETKREHTEERTDRQQEGEGRTGRRQQREGQKE